MDGWMMDGWVLSKSTFLISQVGSRFFQQDETLWKKCERMSIQTFHKFSMLRKIMMLLIFIFFRLSYIRLLPLGCSIILVLPSGWNQTGRSGTMDFLWLLHWCSSSGRNQTGPSVTKDFLWLFYWFSSSGCNQKPAGVVLRTFVMKQAVGGSLSQFFAFCPWPLSTSLTTASEPAIPTKHM
jgi:hypothetical protein